ncbi:hypothetical protein ACFLYO_07865 [Chloroflexota bacterium]
MTKKFEACIYVGLLTAVFLTLLLMFLLNPLHINHDAALHLELGNFLLDGRQPYVDYYETNPPLIHYINTIPAVLARLTGLNPIPVFWLLVYALTVWSALSIRHLLQRYLPQPDLLSVNLLPISIALFGLYVSSLVNHGQREHLFVLLFMPYFVLRWLRWQGLAGQVRMSSAIGLGILAAVGACIKPYFLLAVALPELYWLIKYRRLNNLWAPEILSFGATGLLYGVHFLLLPAASRDGFFGFIIGEVHSSYYNAFGHMTVAEFFKQKYLLRLVVLIIPFILLPIRRRQGTIWHLTQPLALFGLASFVSFVYQAKGWNYHRIPFDMAVMLTGTLLFFTTRLRKSGVDQPGYSLKRVRVALIPLLLLTVRISMDDLSFYPITGESAFVQHIVTTHSAENDAILMLDANVAPTFPTLMQNNRRAIGSFPHDFPLAFGMRGVSGAAYYDPTSALPTMMQFYLDVIRADIEDYEPHMIIVRQAGCLYCPPGFDPVRFLEARGFVEDVIEPGYTRLESPQYDEFAVWLRNSD